MASIGFIGLGNVGAKLAGTLLRNKVDLTIRDLDKAAAQPLLDAGAKWAGESQRNGAKLRYHYHLLAITCHFCGCDGS